MRFLLVCSAAAVLAACTSTPIADAGDMGAIDLGIVDASDLHDTTDCDMDCPTGRACCLGPSGPQCVDLANDILNCGVCNRDCVALRRGDSCGHYQCGCGDFDIGCTGAENSICCTTVTGIHPFCANPGLDFDNCGGCGRHCDAAQASLCSGGMCLCGDTGGVCAGTVDDTCCADPAGAVACVDMRTDQAHCGSCGRRCSAFERCEAGDCVTTLGDAGT